MASGVEVTLLEDVPEIIEEVERELGAGGTPAANAYRTAQRQKIARVI